jgi:hypothetical protein
VQMMQMNVPQLAHGYPSEARSSFLQNLQIMASRSRSCWAISLRSRGQNQKRMEQRAASVNLHQGPHFTTRLAACSQVDILSGPASCQPSGTGANRRFSPSHSKQSQPFVYSLATATDRRNGPRLRSGVRRRSRSPIYGVFVDAPAAVRRSILRLSAAAGVTSHTSHLLPVESRNVR